MKICSECENFSVDEEGYRRCLKGGCGYNFSPVKKINAPIIKAQIKITNNYNLSGGKYRNLPIIKSQKVNNEIDNEGKLWYHKM